jgi:hypothetical protein
MIDVRKNHRELMTDSKRTRDSAIRFCEPSVQYDGGQFEIELTHLVPLLEKDLIVLRQCSTEDDTRDALKIVYPLLTLRPLTANVDHMY